MNLLKVCTRRLVFVATIGILSMGGVSDATASDLFSFRGGNDCCQAAQKCECQQCDCAGHGGKGNLFKRSMDALMGHLHALLPSKSGCDDTPCDDACDSMMLEELIEMQDSIEADPASSQPSSSDRVDNVQTISGTGRIVIVAPLGGAAGRATIANPPVSDQVEPSDRPLEDLSRSRIPVSSPRLAVPRSMDQSEAIVIPSPIRNDNL